GMPLAAAFMKKYGRRVVADGKEAGEIPLEAEHGIAPLRFSLMKNNTIKLVVIFMLAAVGVELVQCRRIPYTLFRLLFGILALNTNLVPKSVLESAKSFSFMMVALIFVIIGTMGGITPQDVAENILAVILILALGIFGIMTGGLIASKIVGWHP